MQIYPLDEPAADTIVRTEVTVMAAEASTYRVVFRRISGERWRVDVWADSANAAAAAVAYAENLDPEQILGVLDLSSLR